MANPIKASDLFLNDGTFRTATEELEAMRVAYLRLLKDSKGKAVELKKEIKGINVANAQGRQRLQKRGKQVDQVAKAELRYKKALTATNQQLKNLQDRTRKANRQATLQARLTNAAAGSYDELAAQYEINRIKLQALSQEQRENTKEGRDLVETTRDLRLEMKRQKKEIDDNTLNVGNYSDSIKQALANVSSLPGATGAATRGVTGLGTAFKALLANPVVLVLSAIVGALSLLIGAFTKTQRGAILVEQAFGFIQGALSGLIGVADDAATAVINFVEDPIQGIKDLGQAIVDNIQQRFDDLLKSVTTFGAAFTAFFSGRFKEAGKLALEAGKDFANAVSIVRPKDIDALSDAIRRETKEIIDSGRALANLALERRRVAAQNRDLTKSVGELAKQEAELRGIADSNTVSFKQIQEAQEGLIQVQEKRLAAERQIAQNNLSLLNTEIAVRRRNGEDIEQLYDQQIQALGAVQAAERELIEAQVDNEEKRRQVIQDRLERDLDILIDGFDNQKTINERAIADENRTLEERQKIQEETVKLSDRSFKQQIETIKQFTDAQFDANELIREQDATVLNERIRSLGLSEIIEGRLLEIIRDRKSAIDDLTRSQNALIEAEREQARTLSEAIVAGLEQAREKELEAFEQRQELEEARFKAVERSEDELTEFQLRAERERLEKLIELNERLGGDLTDVQVETLRETIKGIDRELSSLEAGNEDLLSRLGFKFDAEQREGIQSSFGFVKEQFAGLLQARQEQARKALELANSEVEAARSALEKELDLQQQGRTNRAESARIELQNAKVAQERAERQQQRAQRAQLAAQTVQQTSNLITATSKIFAQIGNPLFSIPLIGLMWSTFAASKIRAFQLSKTIFKEGGQRKIKGGSHKSGDDVFIGYDPGNGAPMYAEGGERMAIFSKKAEARHGSMIERFVDAANKGNLDQFLSVASAGGDLPVVVGGAVLNYDDSASRGYLKKMSEKDSRQVFETKEGGLIEIYKNRKRKYV
jgi:hypothetical protein